MRAHLRQSSLLHLPIKHGNWVDDDNNDNNNNNNNNNCK